MPNRQPRAERSAVEQTAGAEQPVGAGDRA